MHLVAHQKRHMKNKTIPLLNRLKSNWLFPALCLAGVTSGFSASMVTIAEDPNSFTSSLSGTSTYDFNSLKTGKVSKNVDWKGVGTFDQLYVIPANQYGGAPSESQPKGSNYSVQGIGSPVKATTLTLDTPSSYFGFYWSAGDSSNMLQFFNGRELVAEFTTKSLLANLPADYLGNALNKSQNTGEAYAFVNFYGDQSTQWDTVVMTNSSTSGFESDNYTSRVAAWSAEKDGAITGRPIVVVEGTTVTKVDAVPEKWAFSTKAPAAPAPPLYALIAFAAVVGLRGWKSTRANKNSRAACQTSLVRTVVG